MITVAYPEPDFRLKNAHDKQFVFCSVRKRWVVLNPEEWVRQNFIAYLLKVLKYPSSLIAAEKEIYMGELKKRFDILVYDRDHQPWMMIECKEPSVVLSELVLQQVLRYHMSVPVDYLVITNGASTVGWRKEKAGLTLLVNLPKMA